MTLMMGNGPFGPGHGWSNAEVGGDHMVYAERWPRRIRAVLAGETVADSTATFLVHQTGQLPGVYFPPGDVNMELLERSEHRCSDEVLGEATYWSLRVGDKVATDAAWSYQEPPDPSSPLAGHITFEAEALDQWFEENEEVYAHLRDPYHRVDVRASSRHVVVRADGEVVADSTRPKLLFETGLPTRYYLPPTDVRTELLSESDYVSPCPYKGPGQHWHLDAGGKTIEDAVWSLPYPLPEALGAGQHLCFYPDKVQIEVDGEPVTA